MKISNKFNEIFINYLLTNLNDIISINKYEYTKIKNHIIPLLNSGISNNGSYIILPLIGLTIPISNVCIQNNTTANPNTNSNTNTNTNTNSNINNCKTQFVTNLRELIEFNHSKLLVKAFNENRNDIILEYDKFMSKKIKDYFEVLRLLQKHLKYINSDVKLTNVFIKIDNTKNKILNNWGFITNFKLILSDLEKSSIIINNLKITTKPLSPLKIILAHLIKKGLMYDIRYSCDNIAKSCNKISIFDFDLLIFIIDYYAYMLRINNDYIATMNNIFNMMNEFISIEILNVLSQSLNKGKYKIDKNYSFIIGNILQKICNSI